MGVKFLSPEAALRVIELAGNSYRPKEIIALKDQIDGETRAAEVNASITGCVDMNRINKIVAMKLELDALYGEWAEGKIS